MPGQLTIVGLGPGPIDCLTIGALEAIRATPVVDVCAVHHPAVAYLRSEAGQALVGSPEWRVGATAAPRVVETLASRLAAGEAICYIVPGHPLMANREVPILLTHAETAGITVRIVAGLSPVEAALGAMGLAIPPGLQVAGIADLDDPLTQAAFPNPEAPLLVVGITGRDDGLAARQSLLRRYAPDHPVCPMALADSACLPEMSLDALALLMERGAVSALFLPARAILSRTNSLRTLEYVTARLRAPDGCPWDREQTHESIRRNLIEETYELLEAFDEGDPAKCREELGDLLMQVFLHAQMGREAGEYDLADVTRGIVEKLVRRHPHVFSNVEVNSVADVLQNWDSIKQAEGKRPRSALAGIPIAMPALAYAQGAQERAARAGFAWPDTSGAWAKLDEELAELRHAQQPDDVAMELGDLLFVLAGLAQYLGIQAEDALRAANYRFRRRFSEVEALAQQRKLTLRAMPSDGLLALWQEAKAQVSS